MKINLFNSVLNNLQVPTTCRWSTNTRSDLIPAANVLERIWNNISEKHTHTQSRKVTNKE